MPRPCSEIEQDMSDAQDALNDVTDVIAQAAVTAEGLETLIYNLDMEWDDNECGNQASASSAIPRTCEERAEAYERMARLFQRCADKARTPRQKTQTP